MANKPFISARIPEDLQKKLESYVEETERSKTDIIVDALEAYFDVGSKLEKKNSGIEKRLESLENHLSKRFEALEQQIVTLVAPERLQQLDELTRDLKELEKKGVKGISIDWSKFLKSSEKRPSEVHTPLRRLERDVEPVRSSLASSNSATWA